MIVLPKYKDLYSPQIISAAPTKLKGEFKLVKMDRNGRFLQETPWQPNMLLDNGLYRWHDTTNSKNIYHIGDDNTPTTKSMTQLVNLVATSGSSGGGASSVNLGSGGDYAMQQTQSRRFQGTEALTIREIGIGHVATSLSVRNVVSDFTKSSDQIIDVYYRLTETPDRTDVTGSISISGVTYYYILRGCDLPNTSIGPLNSKTQLSYNTGSWGTYTGNITTDVLAGPAGSLGGANSTVETAFNVDTVAGTSTETKEVVWGLDTANGVIRSFKWKEGHTWRLWQLQIGQGADATGTALTKTYRDVLSMYFSMAWKR
jgi:hypothetical protein